MELGEFLGYIEFGLLGIFEKVLVEFLVEAAKALLLTPSKGFIDGHMAALANSAKIKCSKCESFGRWSPIVERKRKESKLKEEKTKEAQH